MGSTEKRPIGKEPRRRVAKERAALVRERLREARLRHVPPLSLKEAAELIENERVRQGEKRRQRNPKWDPRRTYGTTATTVARYEGGATDRAPSPYIEYVEAAAEVFGVQLWYLLGEPEPGSEGQDAGNVGAMLLKLLAERAPSPVTQQHEELRTRVRGILSAALRVPATPGLWTRYLPLVEDIFWKAYDRRGLSPEQLYARAAELGGLMLTPHILPTDGFRHSAELTEDEYRRFWEMQIFALRTLLRPPPPPGKDEPAPTTADVPWSSVQTALHGDLSLGTPAEELDHIVRDLAEMPLGSELPPLQAPLSAPPSTDTSPDVP